MIKELAYLTPAEILLIENPSVTVDKLARVTFFDLVFKNVLVFESDPKATKKERKNPTVSVGSAFNNYEPFEHESIFLDIFALDKELKIKLSNLLKTAFEKVKSGDDYKLKYVYSDQRLKPYFKSNLFQSLFGIKVISERGIKVQKEIKSELRRIRTNTTKKNPSIVESLLVLRGNIVLIPKIPAEIFELLGKEEKNFRKENSNAPWADYCYSGLYYHNTTKNQFDLVAINDSDIKPILESVNGFEDSSGDSGCGSDGGCGGCSGCGGCGGCGG